MVVALKKHGKADIKLFLSCPILLNFFNLILMLSWYRLSKQMFGRNLTMSPSNVKFSPLNFSFRSFLSSLFNTEYETVVVKFQICWLCLSIILNIWVMSKCDFRKFLRLLIFFICSFFFFFFFEANTQNWIIMGSAAGKKKIFRQLLSKLIGSLYFFITGLIRKMKTKIDIYYTTLGIQLAAQVA